MALLKLLQEQYDITPTAQPVLPNNIAGAGKEEPNVVRIINKDGTVTEIPVAPAEETTEGKPTDKLTDEQLKDLVESYLHPTKVKEADAIEEKAEE